MTGHDASRRLDETVARARREREQREAGYREQALRLYPWVCGRCQREFTRENLSELTVHHRDHDHDNNPPDGSNWELLCLYCHDNEHRRLVDAQFGAVGEEGGNKTAAATHRPFEGLAALLEKSQGTGQ
ncbi:MAG: HNH nuclease family protein [Gammaproteobacteria bacterium]|nr:HNH nuclease family protein [Gammaproteobacteria bacterium]